MGVRKAFLLFYLVSTIAAVKWPRGTYTLIKPDTGCPNGWIEGWRFQDNENNPNKNLIDTSHHFYGIVGNTPRDFEFHFCTKDPHDFNDEGTWPAGNYCIMRHGYSCPSGFNYGTIFWDDENTNNMNRGGGALPSGIFDSDTTIHYCCRGDGYWMTPIKLPNMQPFFTIRYTSFCPLVEGMITEEIGVYFSDERDNNRDSASGSHPFRYHFGRKYQFPCFLLPLSILNQMLSNVGVITITFTITALRMTHRSILIVTALSTIHRSILIATALNTIHRSILIATPRAP